MPTEDEKPVVVTPWGISIPLFDVLMGLGFHPKRENGMVICEELRMIFKYANPQITQMPEIKKSCRIVEMGEAITLPSFISAINTILIVNMNKEFPVPHRSPDSVGYDLYSMEDKVLQPGEFEDVRTGIYCAFPPHIWGLIISRSSTFKKQIMTHTAIIDPGFQGELFAMTHNIGKTPYHVKPGDRLTQLIPMMDVPRVRLKSVESPDDFPTTMRGTAGFGSTGV
jgi:dUTP pyrophosphatase